MVRTPILLYPRYPSAQACTQKPSSKALLCISAHHRPRPDVHFQNQVTCQVLQESLRSAQDTCTRVAKAPKLPNHPPQKLSYAYLSIIDLVLICICQTHVT